MSLAPNKHRIWEYFKTGFWLMLINAILANWNLMPTIGAILGVNLLAIAGFIVLDIFYGWIIEAVAARSGPHGL